MENEPRQGPLGDVLPGKDDADPRTGGAKPPERVEDRPAVGQVTPEDYPLDDRQQSRPEGADKPTETQDNPNLSTEHQREGDARRPRDVLDRDDAKRDPESGATIPDS